MDSIQAELDRFASTHFGINTLKPYQKLVMQRIVEQERNLTKERRNQLVVLPTGMGKSICFLVPAALCNGITVIIYPLLALMNDQIARLRKANVNCVCIRGGQTEEQRKEIWEKLKSGTKIVITNPEALLQKQVISRLMAFGLRLLVVDEAHVISGWGKEFRPSFRKLETVVKALKPNQILAFTATASKTTIQNIITYLFAGKRPLVIKADSDRENIYYSAFPTLSKSQGVLHILKECQRPAIVFCRKRNDTLKLCLLAMHDLFDRNMRYYHAGLGRKERESIEDWFMKSQNGVLFSTSAFGLGVDKKNVRTVIHHGIPKDAEEYLQQSGRGGRDGKEANAVVIIAKDDNTKGEVKEVFLKSHTNCRRASLLELMGQHKEECTGCDVCSQNVLTQENGLKEISELISLSPFKFTPQSAAQLLGGSNNHTEIPQLGFFHPYHGLLSNWNMDLLEFAILNLCSKGEVGYVTIPSKGQLLFSKKNKLLVLISKILSFSKKQNPRERKPNAVVKDLRKEC